ncbi:hypothetical protein [Paracidovorax valerianellae]|uniref:hypothetical protein n=1 Tax=Paracidovorax valerianellae TaxID=187868 RepID=UPI002304D123|nr:hypothetical protein [Paracidovorax valerianellae]MDA8444573.1 hypothetical protein [Paracidovorax valerianellae]
MQSIVSGVSPWNLHACWAGSAALTKGRSETGAPKKKAPGLPALYEKGIFLGDARIGFCSTSRCLLGPLVLRGVARFRVDLM